MDLISQNELNKISAFLNSCDDMINGKFILADVKILKILNMIASSEPLYRYIQECMIDFNFEREYSRAEVKNRMSNSNFVAPTEPDKLVALVFCLLVEFDKKQIDFYSFINSNFATFTPGGEYALFAKTLLNPFKLVIANHFGLLNPTEYVNSETATKTVEENPKEQLKQVEEENEETENQQVGAEEIWRNIPILVDSLLRTVMQDRKVKQEQKNDIEYILKSITYCIKYKDMRLVSALVTSLNNLVDKVRSIRFIMEDLKKEVKKYYDLT